MSRATPKVHASRTTTLDRVFVHDLVLEAEIGVYTNEKGVTNTFSFEGMSPNYLSRRGWEKNTLKPGDKVTIEFNPFKDPAENGGMFLSTKIGGKTLPLGGGTGTN